MRQYLQIVSTKYKLFLNFFKSVVCEVSAAPVLGFSCSFGTDTLYRIPVTTQPRKSCDSF